MIFDIIFILIFIWSAYKGFSKGLIIQAAGLAALILGIFGAIRFSDFTAMQIMSRTDYQGNQLPLIAFIVTFIVIVLGVHFIAKITDKLVKAVALGFVNRILGVVFALLKSAFFISVILVILNTVNHNNQFLPEKKIQDSFLYTPLSGLAPLLFPYLRFEVPEEINIPGAPEEVVS